MKKTKLNKYEWELLFSALDFYINDCLYDDENNSDYERLYNKLSAINEEQENEKN